MRGHMAPIYGSGIRHEVHMVHVVTHVVISHMVLVPRSQLILIGFCTARSSDVAASVVKWGSSTVAWIWICGEPVHWWWTGQAAMAG